MTGSVDVSGLPTVSIVMPAFNAHGTIGRALASVQAQSYPYWELWVVDDASTDPTAQYVTSYANDDARVNLIRLFVNSGSPAAPRNKALTRAQGAFIAFIDADDVWEPNKLELQLAAMQRSGAVISCTGAKVIYDTNAKVDIRTPPLQATYATLLKQNTLVCSSVMVDASVLAKRFFPLIGHEDYALWLEIARAGCSVLGVADNLTIYTVRTNSVSANKLKVLPYFWKIYRVREGFSRTKALFLTLRYAWCARKRAFNHIRS